jgi:hypothetical protein
MPEEKQKKLRAVLGVLKGKRALYGSVFFWPIFILAQAGGVGFNLGALGATLLRVAGRDLAFGWESTIQLTSQTVYQIVQAVALPWTWFVPAHLAHPTLQQIEGSKIILKEGIYHLATTDLVSWWPFLSLAHVFYGLLPRVILLAAGKLALARALFHPNFNHAACERLMNRMTTPHLKTVGLTDGRERTPSPGRRPGIGLPPRTAGAEGGEAREAVVLVPEDIYDRCLESELAERLGRLFGYAFSRKIKMGSDPEADLKVLEELAGTRQGAGPLAVLMVQEAWQPPIKETQLFMADVRNTFGPDVPLIIGLIGKPNPHKMFTGVGQDLWEIWRQEIAAMGDPGIWPERLGDGQA